MVLIGLLYNIKNMSNLRGLYKREIRSMDDFENQDADFVYLETLSDYDIRTTLITGKQFVIPDWGVVEFVGFDPFISWVVYTGTDSAFIGGDFLGFTFDHMFISTPLWNVHNIDKVSSTGSQVFIEDTVYVDCAWVGTARNIAQYSGYFNSFQDIWQGFNLESVRLINIGQSTVNSWKNEVSTMFTFDW